MHKQKYWKKENLSIKKDNLQEIVGNRTELEPYKNKEILCDVFVTNTVNYNGLKRLITEVRIPGTNLYIKHLWVDTWNLPLNKVPHGYQKLLLKVTHYLDTRTNEIKYGVKLAKEEKRRNNIPKAKMVIPKWKQELKEAEELKKETKEPKVKKPYGKIRFVKK